MLLRAKHSRLGPLKWGLPAGKIEKNETPLDAATREREEEIGFEHTVELKKTLGPIRDTFYGGAYELYLYQYNWIWGKVRLNYEHVAFKWVTEKEIAKMDIMLGVEQDLEILGIWPKKLLEPKKDAKIK